MDRNRWLQRIRPRQILLRLRREYDGMLQQNRVVFFRCDAIEDRKVSAYQLVEADVHLFEQWRGSQSEFPWPSPEEGPRRFAEGHRLFALVSEGRPRCYGWISRLQTLWLQEIKRTCSVDAPMTWIWDCVTPASMRNRGYYAEFLRSLRRRLRDRDLLIYCHALNTVSYRAILRAGFVPWRIVTQSPARTEIKVLRTPIPPRPARLAALAPDRFLRTKWIFGFSATP